MRRAVCLDLDGTLIDSAPDIAAALNRRLAASGLGPLSLAAITRMIGDGAKVLLTRGFAAAGRPISGPALDDEAAAYIADYERNALIETRPYPGVPETLAALADAGHALAVVTNKPAEATRIVLDALGLAGMFATVAGGDSFPVRKPDPGHLLGALAALDIPSSRAVMVGDHRNDLLAARGAGIASVYAAFGYGEEDHAALGAIAAIDRFADLPGVLTTLFAAPVRA
ncbi:HAD-IA family hydrolase [Elioraea sp.]|uniref:HAD-IA family hydrolase n=1 Tax=Elioraea sp. TaxID=2185103 RepID=UPI0025C06F33|nr:HAD-IA family hydrolase [Elioraea sp.]